MVTRRDVVRLALALPFLGFASAAAAQQKPHFYVVGYVRRAGEYELKHDMTVGDALEAAGGFAPNYRVSGIEIIRVVGGEKQTFNVSLTDAVLDGDTIAVR